MGKRRKKQRGPAKQPQQKKLPADVEADLVELARACKDRQEFERLLSKPTRLNRSPHHLSKLSTPTITHLCERKVSQRQRARVWAKSQEQAARHAPGQPAARIQSTRDSTDEAVRVEGPWASIPFEITAARGRTRSDTLGRVYALRYSGEQIIRAIASGFSNPLAQENSGFPRTWFVDESFKLAGASPQEVQAVAGEPINEGASGRVYQFSGQTASGSGSFILQACQDDFASEARKSLQKQYRGLLFFKYDTPESVLDPDGMIHPRLRLDLMPRPYCPPELVEPYFEHFGIVGRDRVYMFTAESADGFLELNRFEGGFVSGNPIDSDAPPAVNANPGQSIAIGKEVIRVMTQLYASTFDARTCAGHMPMNVNINNGDVLIKPGNLSQPKIRVSVVTDAYYGSPAIFVDEMVTPRSITEGDDRPHGMIMEPTRENLPHILEAVEAGLRPRFGSQAPSMARSWLKEYAGTQEPLFDDTAGQFVRIARAASMSDETMARREILDATQNMMLSRMLYNPYFKLDFVMNASDAVRQGGAGVSDILRHAERVKPKACPRDFIQAIREL